jgi:hypothetical protein
MCSTRLRYHGTYLDTVLIVNDQPGKDTADSAPICAPYVSGRGCMPSQSERSYKYSIYPICGVAYFFTVKGEFRAACFRGQKCYINSLKLVGGLMPTI